MIFEIALRGQVIIGVIGQRKPTGDRPKSPGIRSRRRGTTLNLAFCFALFLGLGVIAQGQAENYYIYQTPNGALVISNKEPPPVSKIIRQHSWPEATDSEVAQSQQPNQQPNEQTGGSSKPSKSK
jgi:hypothetical protein